jgi:hypothetical protein
MQFRSPRITSTRRLNDTISDNFGIDDSTCDSDDIHILTCQNLFCMTSVQSFSHASSVDRRLISDGFLADEAFHINFGPGYQAH